MSAQTVAKFYETLREDEALREQAKDIQDQAGLIAFAKAKGFDFTGEELNAFAAEQAKMSIPLSDDELEKVAAGGYNRDDFLMTTVCYWCDHWRKSADEWYAAEGYCGSCFWWKPHFLAYIGHPGVCLCWDNKRKK